MKKMTLFSTLLAGVFSLGLGCSSKQQTESTTPENVSGAQAPGSSVDQTGQAPATTPPAEGTQPTTPSELDRQNTSGTTTEDQNMNRQNTSGTGSDTMTPPPATSPTPESSPTSPQPTTPPPQDSTGSSGAVPK